MKRFAVAVLIAFAVTLGFMAISATEDSVSAQEQSAVTIECTQAQLPTPENNHEGALECTLTVTTPAEFVYTLTLSIYYEDVNQDGVPSFGDILVCWEVELPSRTIGTCSAS